MRRTLILALYTVFSGMLHAYDVEVDGIYYGIIIQRFAYVTYRDLEATAGSYSGKVVVPAQINYKGRTYPVSSIGENAFAGCEELKSVQLPSTVRGVNSCAFLGCTNLQQVSIPTTIQSVNSCAFTGCTSLEQVVLPRRMELVDSLTLYCCASLTSVVLPHRVRTICNSAMEHLPAMTNLYCFASTPPIVEQGAFTLSDQQRCTLHVPKESLQLYRESPEWSNFYRIVALNDENYRSQNYQRGDINDDGQIDAEDLALLRRLIVSLPDNASVRWAADIWSCSRTG